VPRHIARLITRLVAPLVIDYFASRRLVVDYSASRRLVVDYSPSRRLTTPPCVGSSSTTSTPPRVRVPLHVARLVMRLITRLVAPLVVDYSASRRLVVDYFDSAVHPGASARRTAHHAARHDARRRLLRLAQSCC
jgi:hypothetical protein